ncbi:FeoB-associated Cys-rich membrane protein [Clostridium sp. 19966]|nr:FeoB-associated Cys-rich membrane protein [Clostridium sp. 19966]MDT8718655.1 FeoB-associated Cys-rich membrane protein [Clostridium sp. 19966]
MEIVIAIIIVGSAGSLFLKNFKKAKNGDCGCGKCDIKKRKLNR